VRHAWLRDEAGHRLDEALVTVFRAPRSYTAEDVVEFGVHGGAVSARRVLRALLQAGARLAERGEFTKRAFLNGRLDLSQAEAVADVVRARTERGADLALAGLAGKLAARTTSVESQLLDLLARLEVNLDFNEDVVAVDRDRIGRVLDESRANLEELRGRAPWARRITIGATVALVGRPNVGKSSLFNALLQDERALVAETPGTTRDYLEAWLDIAGIPVRLIDTAGVREAEGVEAQGVARAAKWDREADLRLRVFDATEPAEAARPREVPRDANQLVCWNKLDLAEPPTGAAEGLFVSARTGRGIPELRQSIADRLLEGVGREPADEVAPSERHEDAIRRATDALDRGARAWRDGVTEEWLAGDVRDATAALGEITGRTAGEEVLDRIFSKFCIGK
jgi:tRNA modification GTPase